MIESRCGLLCSKCSYRESHGCKGCAETNGHPFYGECRVARCCQGKGQQHCGECSDMPCKVLYSFSFLDKEHGDNPPGARLEVVEGWALEGDRTSKPLHIKAAGIMRNAETATIAVIDENGFPKASTISNIKTDGTKLAWFSTGLRSVKVRGLLKNNKCSVCYTDGNNNVTLQGTAEILTDPDTKRRLWLDWYINHFPGGIEDPNYCILRFTAKKAVLWIDSTEEELEFSDIG